MHESRVNASVQHSYIHTYKCLPLYVYVDPNMPPLFERYRNAVEYDLYVQCVSDEAGIPRDIFSS